MTQLRISGMTFLVLALGLGVGCGGGGGTEHDSGVHIDQGMGVDGGGPVDHGVPVDMPTSHDSGPDGSSGGNTCPMGACNLADGTGCPAGQACQLGGTTTATAECQPSGTGTLGATCASNADCSEGFLCEGNTMKCQHYCCMSGTTIGCPTGQTCNVDLTDASGASTGAYLCSNADDMCDVIARTGCPTGQACYPGRMVTLCATPGTPAVAPGGTCMHLNDCGPGYSCVGPAAGPVTCQQVCAMGTDAGPMGVCPGGMTCGGVTGYPTGLGVCG